MDADATPLQNYIHSLADRPAAEPDEVLLDHFVRRRDEAAFTALVARHGALVARVCRRVLGDLHGAEDAFQATFLVLARRAGAVRRPASLAAWLYGVAYRVASKARAAEARRRSRQPQTPDLDPPDPGPDPPAEATARELLTILDEEVRRLPVAYQLAVVLCCLEGLSQEEAARRLGWAPGSLKGRLERGRKRLHRRLARRGLALAVVLAAAEAARGGAAPAAWAAPTADAARRFAADEKLASGPAAGAATLARQVLRDAAVAKLKGAAAAALAVCLLAGVVVWMVRSGAHPAAAVPVDDSAAIQGVWQVTNVDDSGLDVPFDAEAIRILRASKWRFTGDELVMDHPGVEGQPAHFKLDPTQKPKAMDVPRLDDPNQTCRAAYALEGDELTVRLASPLNPVRPTDLTPKKGDGTLRFTLQREKK